MESGGEKLCRYLVVFHLDSPSSDHLLKVGAGVTKVLGNASVTPIENAFRSEKRDVFAYLIKSSLRAGEIHNRIVSPGGSWSATTPAILLGNDSVLVFELGSDCAISRAFSRVSTWLQRK